MESKLFGIEELTAMKQLVDGASTEFAQRLKASQKFYEETMKIEVLLNEAVANAERLESMAANPAYAGMLPEIQLALDKANSIVDGIAAQLDLRSSMPEFKIGQAAAKAPKTKRVLSPAEVEEEHETAVKDLVKEIKGWRTKYEALIELSKKMASLIKEKDPQKKRELSLTYISFWLEEYFKYATSDFTSQDWTRVHNSVDEFIWRGVCALRKWHWQTEHNEACTEYDENFRVVKTTHKPEMIKTDLTVIEEVAKPMPKKLKGKNGKISRRTSQREVDEVVVGSDPSMDFSGEFKDDES